MQETEHYNLKKPSVEDFYNIADQNGNMDKVDAALHELEEGKADLDPMTGKVRGDQLPDMAYVPTTRKVNGKELSADIALTAGDVGARPSSWTPTAADVGAAPASHVDDAVKHISATERAEWNKKVTRFPHKYGPYDLNAVATEGIHEFQGVCTNSPYDEWGVVDQHFWVKVFRHQVEGYLHQELIDVRSQRTFERSRVNGEWLKWLPTTGMDVGDISTNMAHIRYGAPYPGWLICNGAVLPYWQYPELDKAAGGRYRAGFSRALTVNATVSQASYGRCSSNLANNFIFILNTNYGVKLYEYIKSTGEVREINSGGGAGYNGLYPVIGSEYVLYVKRTNNSSAIKIHVISPPSYYGGPVLIGPEISANAPNSNTHENAYAAYLKSPGTIEMISIFAQVAMKYGINVVSNAVSTTTITGGPSSYVNMVWVMNAEVRYFTVDNSFSLPRDFTSFSQQTQLGVFQASRQDSKGNGFFTSGVLAWLLRADGSWVHYPNFFVDGEQSHFTSSYGFYWNEQLGYGVVMMSSSVPGGKPLFYFDAGGVVHRDNISNVYLDGEMGIYFTQSPWAATIGYVGSDIRLPSLLDASGQPYAHIRCK